MRSSLSCFIIMSLCKKYGDMKALPYRITKDCQDTGLKSLFGRHSVKDPQVFGLGNQKNTRHHDEVLDDSTRHCGKLLKKYFYSAKTKCCFILLATSQRSRKLLYETGLDRWVIVVCVARRSLHEKRCRILERSSDRGSGLKHTFVRITSWSVTTASCD